MYARKVSLSLKLESAAQFLQKVEHEVIPLLRKQKGFLDQLILSPNSGKTVYVYSFWQNKEDAEKHDCTTLPALTKLLSGMIDGAIRVHNFAGSGGCLSSAQPTLLRAPRLES